MDLLSNLVLVALCIYLSGSFFFVGRYLVWASRNEVDYGLRFIGAVLWFFSWPFNRDSWAKD